MAVTPPPRTHRPVWSRELCRPCQTCRRACPTSLFVEQAEEEQSLRGTMARSLGLPARKSETPPCVSACPLGQDVPGYLRAEAAGDFALALEIVHQTNPFAAVCGRLCHHPCQRACVRKHIDDPVQIRALKLAALRLSGGVKVAATSKKGAVAVIGAGPAGLSTAYFLARGGREVTVYEASEKPGGLLAAVIPAFDLPPGDLAADLDFIRASGVTIQTGARIGTVAEVKNLMAKGALAVVLAVGASQPRQSKVSGLDLEGAHHAVSFCAAYSQGSGPKLSGPAVVAGSGVMAASAARLAIQAGASSVSLLFKRDKRTPSAEPEGIGLAEGEGAKILMGTRPIEITGEGKVRTIVCEAAEGRTELEAAIFIDAEKRDPDLSWLGMTLSKKGSLQTDPDTQMTETEGVFAAGECVTGPRNVIRAIANGMQAARQVNRFLSGDES